MVSTTVETLTVDGVNLKTLAKNIQTLAATLRSPGKRGANAIVAQRDGSLWTPYKPNEEGLVVLPMWVLGCDDDGAIPVGSSDRKEFFKRVDELTHLFDKDYALLDVRHTLPDGTVRQALCECVESLDFTTQGASPIGLVSVALANPAAFWQDVANTTQASSLVGGAPWVWASGGTAPVNDGTYTITGPITTARVTDPTSGAYVEYSAVVAAGQNLIINAGTFVVTGTGGLVPDLTKISYSATGNRLMRMTPDPTRQYRVSLTGTGTTAATQLSISGKRKYKVG